MAVIYNDPGSGTFQATYGSGVFTSQDTNWGGTLMAATTYFNIATSGAGGNLVISIPSAVSAPYWIGAGTWTAPGGLWSEITLANAIGTSAAQEGPGVALSGAAPASIYGYILRLRYGGATNDWTIYSYNNGTPTLVVGPTTYTSGGATDTFALQMVYNSSSSNTLSAYQNNVLLGSGTDTTNATVINGRSTFPSGLWTYNGVSGAGDISNMRGGTGLYLGGSTAYTLNAAQGAYSLVGMNAAQDYAINAGMVSYGLTGFAANLQWSGAAKAPAGAKLKWTPFYLASYLRCLQQGSLNVGNTQQNRVNLYNLAVANANSTATWARWRLAGANTAKVKGNLYLWVPAVPGYVAPPGAPAAR